MGDIYIDPPDIILLSTEVEKWNEFIDNIKNDPVYRHLPLILIISERFQAALPQLGNLPIDDWLFFNESPEVLKVRIMMREMNKNKYLDANPLTRLPGNFSILTKIQTCIDEGWNFALGYLDIDNFKAFNDYYSFALGDDMIRMTARILTNVVKRMSSQSGFVGHIGGDDFVFIVPSNVIEECCQQVIQNFDLVSSAMSNDVDRIRGYIETEDRQGNLRRFPLPTISIAVIDTSITKVSHPGEAVAIAGDIKKDVKKKSGSNYFINRRSNPK
ncbi:MAG: Response regulator receiver modulated diguanylate cyclase [uncultured bacterium]|nr:MAG: Response regulator receiver modulated diguanylate cyclase [uncultured bacterium]